MYVILDTVTLFTVTKVYHILIIHNNVYCIGSTVVVPIIRNVCEIQGKQTTRNKRT